MLLSISESSGVRMEYLNIVVMVVAAYVLFVLLMETLIWRIQPSMQDGVLLTLTLPDGTPMQRKLYGFEYDSVLYVSSNHWFRRWYKLALANPRVSVCRHGKTAAYSVQQVTGAARSQLLREYDMGVLLRFVCGFAPSKFLKLVPVNNSV